MTDKILTIEPLTGAGFAPYGDVIESGDQDSFFINNGMAERFHALARVEASGEKAGTIISLGKNQKYEMPRKGRCLILVQTGMRRCPPWWRR